MGFTRYYLNHSAVETNTNRISVIVGHLGSTFETKCFPTQSRNSDQSTVMLEFKILNLVEMHIMVSGMI